MLAQSARVYKKFDAVFAAKREAAEWGDKNPPVPGYLTGGPNSQVTHRCRAVALVAELDPLEMP